MMNPMTRASVSSLILASCLLICCCCCCEANLLSFKRNKEPDAITLLNNKLVNASESAQGLEANVELARKLLASDEEIRSNEKLRAITELFSKLQTSDPCERSNVAHLRQLLELAGEKVRQEVSSYAPGRRLVKLLDDLSETMHARCYALLDARWYEDRTRNDWQSLKADHLEPLLAMDQRLIKRAPAPSSTVTNSDLKLLHGALAFQKSLEASETPTGADMKLLAKVVELAHYYSTGSIDLKVDERTGKPVRVDAATMGKLMNAYLTIPCQKLMGAEARVKGFFEPLADLAYIRPARDSIPASRGPASRSWATIEWTSRYIFCRSFLEKLTKKAADRAQ